MRLEVRQLRDLMPKRQAKKYFKFKVQRRGVSTTPVPPRRNRYRRKKGVPNGNSQ